MHFLFRKSHNHKPQGYNTVCNLVYTWTQLISNENTHKRFHNTNYSLTNTRFAVFGSVHCWAVVNHNYQNLHTHPGARMISLELIRGGGSLLRNTPISYYSTNCCDNLFHAGPTITTNFSLRNLVVF